MSNNPLHDFYCEKPASLKNAIEIFKDEWVSFLPGFNIGHVPLFEDERVQWAINQAGGVEGKCVLELGPLEGGHTYMLYKAGAKSITTIEANSRCFLKCLITKQLFNLSNVISLYGDFVKFLKEPNYYDYIHAAGVLYHLIDPVGFLNLLCQSSKSIYLWTHYADKDAMPEDDERFTAGIVGCEDLSNDGFSYKGYRRRYLGDTNTDAKFCGGIYSNPIWIEKKTILHLLNINGFEVEIAHDMPNHPNGPCCSFFAQKRG